MHRTCEHDSSDKFSIFVKVEGTSKTSEDREWIRQGYEEDETKSKDEVDCDWSDSKWNYGTLGDDLAFRHGGRSLQPADITPSEGETEYGWSGQNVTFDPGGHNPADLAPFQHGGRPLQQVDTMISSEGETENGWSGENVTFDPGGHNPADHAPFQHGGRSVELVDIISLKAYNECGWSGENVTFDPGGHMPTWQPMVDGRGNQSPKILDEPASDASTDETNSCDGNTCHDNFKIREKTSSLQKKNLSSVFHKGCAARKEEPWMSDKDLNTPSATAFEEPDITFRTPEKGNGVLDFCYFVSSLFFLDFGINCDTERQFFEPTLRRIKSRGVYARDGFDRNFWTHEFGLDCFETRPINMGWDVAFIFKIEESPFVYDVCYVESDVCYVESDVRGKRSKSKKVRVSASVFALDGTFIPSLFGARFRNVYALNKEPSAELNLILSSKGHVVSAYDNINLFELGHKNIFSDFVKFCKRVYLVSDYLVCPCISRLILRPSGPSELYVDSRLPSHRTHVQKTWVSVTGPAKKVNSWHGFVTDVIRSGYKRVGCITESRDKSLVESLCLDLTQHGCRVVTIDDGPCGMSELCSIEKCLLSCDCFIVVITSADVSREVAFTLNTVIASGMLSIYSVVTSCDLINYLPSLLKPFPIVTMETAFPERDIALFGHDDSYRTYAKLTYGELSYEYANHLTSFRSGRIRVLMDEDDNDAIETIRYLSYSSCFVINDEDISEGKPIFTELARELYTDETFVVLPPKSEPSPVYCYALKVLFDRMGFDLGEICHKSYSAYVVMFNHFKLMAEDTDW